jgi:hypothetical protein
MVTFNDLHSDGWENNSFLYQRSQRFTLGETDLGKLKKCSYKGSNTKELFFGDDSTYFFRVEQNEDGTLKITDPSGLGTKADNVDDNFIIQEKQGGKKKIRKTKRKMNKKRKSNKRR